MPASRATSTANRASLAPSTVVHQVRHCILRTDGHDLSDGQLLRRFIDARDENAFEGLVCRHAAMVYGVCRRILGHAQDAARSTKHAEAEGPDDNAGDQIGDDGGEAEPARDRNAGDGRPQPRLPRR